jgi:molybdate transport system substrate-binding protein
MIKILTSNATHAVLNALARVFERETAREVVVGHASAQVILARIKDGERADVAVLNAPDIDELVTLGVLAADTRRPFARSRIGIAVRSGRPHPDISTPESLKRTLMAARSVAHTVHGASGRYVPELFERLGISDSARPKTVTRPGGLIGELVAAGEAEIAVQQISELLAVSGIELVGPLPQVLQKTFESAAALFVESDQRTASEALLRFFAAPSSAATFTERGLEAAGRNA